MEVSTDITEDAPSFMFLRTVRPCICERIDMSRRTFIPFLGPGRSFWKRATICVPVPEALSVRYNVVSLPEEDRNTSFSSHTRSSFPFCSTEMSYVYSSFPIGRVIDNVDVCCPRRIRPSIPPRISLSPKSERRFPCAAYDRKAKASIMFDLPAELVPITKVRGSIQRCASSKLFQLTNFNSLIIILVGLYFDIFAKIGKNHELC